MVDLNVIVEALENNGFYEEDTRFPDVLEFSKTLRSGEHEVFTLDFNDYTVTKERFNSNGTMQPDATKNFTVKHASDLNSIFQIIA